MSSTRIEGVARRIYASEPLCGDCAAYTLNLQTRGVRMKATL
jgi:hypothetical protein